ncbi:MAG: hypothetical protein AB7O52_07500 [Planctomycetota bacterium]
MTEFLLVACVVTAILLFQVLVVHRWDKARIAQYIRARRGKLLRAKWSPFGPGWSGSQEPHLSNWLSRQGWQHSRGVLPDRSEQ